MSIEDNIAGRLIYPCDCCGKEFKRTNTEAKRGRRFCCRACYLIGKQKELDSKKANRKCANDACVRKDVVARGLCNACYQRWLIRFGKSAKWINKTCPTCEVDFPTYEDRTFCSHKCYLASDFFKEHRQKYSQKMAEARENRQCLYCQADMSLAAHLLVTQKYADGKTRTPKKFCRRACHRKWFAERFDRVVANYRLLELTMSYDEFLTKEELPCLVAGCDWTGQNLSIHCNHVHGIDAATLKAMVGFNRGTGVVTCETSIKMSNRLVGRQAGDDDIASYATPEMRSKPRGPMRPEGRENHRKSAAIKSNQAIERPPS